MKRKVIIIISVILMIIGVTIGISYAYFYYSKTGNANELLVGEIYLHYDGDNTISINNLEPRSTRDSSTHYDFTVDGKNTNTEHDIIYGIDIINGAAVQNKVRIADKFLRFTLVEVINNSETVLVENVMYNDLSDFQRIYVEEVPANTSSEVVHNYKLYMWIDNSVNVGNTSNADYSMTEWNNLFASIRVRILGDFSDKSVNSGNNLYNVVRMAVSDGYAEEYTGLHKDSLTSLGSQKIYYYNGPVKDTDSSSATYNETMNNVIFGGFCWQMLRTTDTGGVKLVYNGRPVNNQCLSSRSDQKGIISSARTNTTVSSGDYYYGTKFEVDYDNQTFKLAGTLSHAVWSNSTRNSLLGLYTCKSLSSTATCATLYYIDGINSSTNATVVPLTVANTHYGQIGTSGFNVVYDSPGYIGYMYNTIYHYHEKSDFTSNDNFFYGNDYGYENGSYHLDANKSIISIANWSSSYNTINNNHYTCFNTTGICDTLYYIYYTTSSKAFYFELNNNVTHIAMLNEMIAADNVNIKDSTAKKYLESWYENNLIDYTSYIENTIYCNNRELLQTTQEAFDNSGWNPNGGNTANYLYFKECYDNEYILKCQNINDSFAVGNSKAPLNYPVGLLTFDEATLAYRGKSSYVSFLRTGASTWLMSPPVYASYTANIRAFDTDGGLRNVYAGRNTTGMRPVISLKSTSGYISGNGSESQPYIIDTTSHNPS